MVKKAGKQDVDVDVDCTVSCADSNIAGCMHVVCVCVHRVRESALCLPYYDHAPPSVQLQGEEHLLGWCAAQWGSAVFIDAQVTGADKVDADYTVVSVCSVYLHDE